MKNYVILLLALLLTNVLAAAEKKAFIVAISKFKNGYKEISSTKDLVLLDESLGKQKFSSIVSLANEKATKKNVEESLTNFINTQVNPGDVVYLHFSTHGRQIQDISIPKDEAESLDECLVMYDSDLKLDPADPKKSFSSFLTDDEVGKYVEKLRTKLGSSGDLIVAIDACHSGTGERGDDIVRGGYEALTAPGFKYTDSKEENNFNELPETDESDKASYVVFSASQADLVNRELKMPAPMGSIGSLSYAICTALNSLQEGEKVTYRKLFEDVREVMTPLERFQLPAIEGNGKDRGLFAGDYVAQKPYYRVDAIKSDVVTIQAGFMNKLYEGSKVAFCKAGSAGPGQNAGDTIYATGTVTKTSNFLSDVKLDAAANIPKNAWVFITEQAFGKIELKVDISKLSPAGKAWVEQIDWKEKAPFVKFSSDQPHLYLIEDKNEEGYHLRFPDEYYKNLKTAEMINERRGPIQHAEDLRMELSNFLQYRLLSALDLKDEDVRIEFKLIPFVNGDTCMKCVEQKTINGVLHLEEGDTVKILAINKGTKNAFFNILDFEPYGNMNLILTGEAQNLNPSSDLLVKYTIAGHTKKLVENPIRIFPPFGNEVFKLIASETPIDLSHIIEVSRSGSEPKSDLSILDKYILNSTGTRGGETGTIKKDKSNGSTYDLNFVIRPKTEPVTAIKKN